MEDPHFQQQKQTRPKNYQLHNELQLIFMSLFKLKNLWLQSFSSQQFDERHLSLGRVDDQPALALGSFSGCLRVFLITNGQKLKVDLIFQTKLESPIIDIEFVPHPQQRNKNTIGVLLYRKFLYISLRKNLQTKVYQQKKLVINSEPAFAIQKSTVSLMTLNSSIQYLNPLSIQSIKVSDPIFPFARDQDIIYHADGQQLVMVQNSAEQWRIIVGPMRSIHLFKEIVVIIGDNALWEVQQSHIRKTKVLEQDVSCGTIIKKDNDYNIIVANFANQIFIYTSTYKLIWAIKANQVPIKICIFNQGFLFGTLAWLGQQGTISISYLGTEVPQTNIQPINEDIDMQQVQIQTQKMLTQLKKKQQAQEINQHHEKTQSKSDVKLALKQKRPRPNKQIIDDENKYFKNKGQTWICEVQCTITPIKQPIYQISLTVSTPSNIICMNNDLKFTSIKEAQKFDLILICSCQKFPYTNQIQVTIRYQTSDKREGFQVISQICELPLDFQCSLKSLQLQEKPSNKIVFTAASDLPAFSEIFYQFGSSIGTSKNITIILANGILCSMGYNKNNTKVKIQSNFYSGLCYMFIIFNTRLIMLGKQNKISKNQITIEVVPLQQLYTLMKDHFDLRASLKQKSVQLQKRCQQFRSTQKKLIIKMKQKVSSINNMDKLLEYTYRKLIAAADAYQQAKQQLQAVNHNLQVALYFVLQLLFMKTKSTPKCRQKVLGIIGYQKQSSQYGWQEKVLSNSAHFLNKKFNFMVDRYTFDQVYKTVLWVVYNINQQAWNQ